MKKVLISALLLLVAIVTAYFALWPGKTPSNAGSTSDSPGTTAGNRGMSSVISQAAPRQDAAPTEDAGVRQEGDEPASPDKEPSDVGREVQTETASPWPGRTRLFVCRTVDEAGLPVSPATVRLRVSPKPVLETESFRLARLQSLDHGTRFAFYVPYGSEEWESVELSGVLAVEDPDYLPFSQELTIPVGGHDDVQVALKSRYEEAAHGIVYDTLRRPMSGVFVQLEATVGEPLQIDSGVTSEDGAFSVRGVQPGLYRVLVRLVKAKGQSLSLPVKSPKEITIDQSPKEEPISIYVDAERCPGIIAGHVMDGESNPIPSAKVSFSYPGYSSQIWSDKEGAFACVGIPEDVSVVEIRASHMDYEPEDFEVPVGETNARLLLRPKTRVMCKVFVIAVATGKPIPGAEVRADPSQTWELTEGGEITLELSEGYHPVHARAAGYDEATALTTVSLESENVVTIELGSSAELRVSVALHEGLRQMLGGESIQDWIARGMLVFAQVQALDGGLPSQIVELGRVEDNQAVFPIGQAVTYSVSVQMELREGAHSETILLASDPLAIPEGAEEATVGISIGGDCILNVNTDGDLPHSIRLSGMGSGTADLLPAGIPIAARQEQRTTSCDEHGHFEFVNVAPGVYSLSCARKNSEGKTEFFQQDVVFSEPGQVIELEWPRTPDDVDKTDIPAL